MYTYNFIIFIHDKKKNKKSNYYNNNNNQPESLKMLTDSADIDVAEITRTHKQHIAVFSNITNKRGYEFTRILHYTIKCSLILCLFEMRSTCIKNRIYQIYRVSHCIMKMAPICISKASAIIFFIIHQPHYM